jgi:exo-1,4-beta-D-glucosaminidase
MNSAWPSFYWQLYDYYLLPTSSYYATRKANNINQLIYDYAKNEIVAVNESLASEQNLKAQIQIFDFNSKLLKTETVPFDIKSITSKPILQLDNYSEDVFLDLKLFDDKGIQIASNFYWLSNKKDVFDWDKTFWGNTPLKEYADFNKLNDLQKSEIATKTSSKTVGNNSELSVTLENTNSKLGFFINFKIVDDAGKTIFPVFWDDNFISVLPNGKRVFKCIIPKNLISNTKMHLIISGWNVNKKTYTIE